MRNIAGISVRRRYPKIMRLMKLIRRYCVYKMASSQTGVTLYSAAEHVDFILLCDYLVFCKIVTLHHVVFSLRLNYP